MSYQDKILVDVLVKICRNTGLTIDDFSFPGIKLKVLSSAHKQLAQKSKKSAKK